MVKPNNQIFILLKLLKKYYGGFSAARKNIGTYFIAIMLFVLGSGVSPAQTITKSIASSSDDAEEAVAGSTYGEGNVDLTSSDIELVKDNEPPTMGNQIVGLRFTGMNIPAGATITSAYLTLRTVAPDAPMTNSEATSLTIKGQLIANSPTFTTTNGDISNRTLTTASTAWSPGTWTTGTDYNSPGIESVIQEIINQGSWASGNALSIIITGTGHRSSQAFDTNPTTAAKLVVTYTTGSISSPGGVSTGLIQWLRADAGTTIATGVSVWADQSSAGRNASQATTLRQPSLVQNAVNFNPALTFNGTSQDMTFSDVGLPSGGNPRSSFAMAANASVDANYRNIFHYGELMPYKKAGLLKGTSNEQITEGWSAQHIIPGVWGVANVPHMVYGNYSSSTARGSYDGSTVGSTSVTAWNTTLTGSGYIGSEGSTDQFWSGKIGEIIQYNSVLSAGDLNRVNTYLALKYGISLNQSTAQNYTASDGTTIFWNGTANSAYKNNIGGIARDDNSALTQKQSKSVNAGLQVVMGNGNMIATDNASNSSTFSADKSALVWGDNGGSASAWTASGAPLGRQIISRTWKVQETGTVGSVKIQIPDNSGTNGLPVENIAVYLLVDADENFTTGAVEILMTLNVTNWEANVDLTNGQFFTFSTSTPAIAPGGVALPKLWLRADMGTSTTTNGLPVDLWIDQSGLGNSATQTGVNRPIFSNNSTDNWNYNPVLKYNGINQWLAVDGLANDMVTGDNTTYFNVNRITGVSGTFGGILDLINSSGSDIAAFEIEQATMRYNLWTSSAGDQQQGTNIQNTSSIGVYRLNGVANTVRNNGLSYNFTGAHATLKFDFSNATSYSIAAESGVSILIAGTMPEHILYNIALTSGELNRVESYLALKYGITLNQTTAQNYIASDGTTIFWNGTTNNIYKNHIAGIVRDDKSALNQKQSKSVNTGLQIAIGNGNTIANDNVSNPNNFASDKSALVWGDDGGSVAAWTTTGAPAGRQIVARIWKVQETGTVGSVKIQIPDNSGTNGLPVENIAVYLLVDADENFASGATEITMTLNGTSWEANVDLTTGQFLTFATEALVGTPVFDMGATSTRCQGAGTVTYTATAANTTGITYSLDAASMTGGNSIVAGTGAVTYAAGWSGTSIITASAAGAGGPKTAIHTVTITPSVGPPVFTLGATSTRCQGAGTVTYTATATNTTGITYTLDAASIAGGNTIVAGTGAVTYVTGWSGTSIITASAAGCNGPLTAIHTVTITPTVGTPVFTLGATSTRCQGAGTVTYTATATNTTGITYTLDAASITGGNTIVAGTGAVTYAAAWIGTSIITASAAGCNGPKTAIHTVTITPTVGTPVFTLGATSTRCQGAGTVTYTATATNTTGITYTLDAASIAGGNSIVAGTGVVTYLAGWSGTSIITASSAGCNGPKTAIHTVTITPTAGTPVFTLGATSTRCQGAGTVTYTATATNTTGITYTLDAASITGGNSIVAGTGAVTYVAGWSGTSIITAIAAGCDSKTSDLIVTTEDVTGPVITCPEDKTEYLNNNCEFIIPDYRSSISVYDNCDPAPSVFQSPSAGTILSGDGTLQPVTITSTDISGNTSSCIFNIILLDNTPPVATCLPDTVITVGEGLYKTEVILPAPLASDNCGIKSVINDFNGGENATGIYSVGITVVNYTVTDVNGNSTQCSQQITIRTSEEFPFGLVIPQGFSPNDDGLNDKFEILGIEVYPENELFVYNIWGYEIYYMHGYNNNWDGTASKGISSGKKLPTGTYYYILKLGNDQLVKGFVYLIKEE